MAKKKIKIQIWTDNYYCRVIGIWRPEEAEDFEAPEDDTTPVQKQNIPYYLVLSSVYEGREEVMGNNPVAPGQHPIPKEFMETQVRHISYMFANEFGIFQAPTKQTAKNFLAKQTNGYKMDKEMEVEVSPAQGSMSLKDFRDSLAQYTDEEAKKIQVMTIGENPKDAFAKGIDEYIHTPNESTTQQYISVTKLTSVYDVEDPYIDKSPITDEVIEGSLPPGTEEAEMSQSTIEGQESMADEMEMNQESLATFDKMEEGMAPEDDMEQPTVTEVQPEPTREEVLEQQVQDLKDELENLKAPNPTEENPN